MKKKLTLEKFSISKLNNLNTIIGGEGDTQGDTITTTKTTNQTDTTTDTTITGETDATNP